MQTVNAPSRPRVACVLLLAGGVMLTAALPATALAQDPPGAVVQAVPPPQVEQLSAAMRRLSSNPKDLDALIEAGEASLVLHDPEAAGNFYARAAVIAPDDGRVRLGYARVALADQRPVQALLLFDQAEKSGADMAPAALERALAFDLVGDNTSAQAIYAAQLRRKDEPQTRLRLAISQAISGRRAEFEKTLYPLLRRQDRGAFRTRAFGLAILGQPDEAVKIADAMMPADLALRMAPYLRYMPRLTRAQQAAAADLGIFPASAQIGHDSTEIAGYESKHGRIASRGDAALIPSGRPLGPRADAQAARLASNGARPTQLARTTGELPAVAPVQGPPADLREQTRMTPQSTLVARQPAVVRQSPSPTVVQSPPSPAPAPPPPPPSPPPRETVADAFAGLGAVPELALRSGAVDMAKFKPRLEQAEVKEAPPKPARKTPEELYPARFWVQVATGKDRKALGWDWRRIAKKADGLLDDKGPFVTKWVEANRLLAGPYPSGAAADKTIKKLKGMGIDCFAFASAAGEKIDTLE